MKVFTRLFTGLFIALIFLHGTTVRGQSILNPNDSVITYNPSKPPAIPAYGSIAKWVRTVRMSWNTNNWKAYIYNGNQFRLRFPNGYNPTANDGKVYPMLIFMHGEGEGGTVYDNEYSFTHGGYIFDTAVANGTWPGYVLIMQTSGGWGAPQMAAQQYIIDYMVKNNKLDQFHVTLNGLSGGGSGDWQLFQSKETYIAGLNPMSSVAIAFDSPDSVKKWLYEPIWNIHGGQDGSPAPYTAAQVLAAMQAQGANYTDLDMTTQGHDTWDSTWSMPAFWPWHLAQYCSNPWTVFGRTWFCTGQTINVTVGLTAGYQAYQWRKNGTVIPGATSNTINVTSVGTYDARVERNNIWSDWSHTPVVIQNPPPTVTPAITIPALMSNVIPAPDGNTGVTLQEPTGYATYAWQKVGSSTNLATTNTYYATAAGQYQAEVTQQYGCSTSFSAPYTVVAANGPNKPDPATALVVTNLSSSSQLLTWNQNPNPNYQETAFEVYQGTQSGGPYKLIAITGPNATTDTVKGLKARISYYYIVRAVNGTGAAANSNEANGATSTDSIPPSTPGNLKIASSTQSQIVLSWTKSTDNVGVTAYNIYVNGALSNVLTTTTTTTFTVTGLNFQQSYNFYVAAVDAAGNISPFSNQVSGEPLISGLTYSYYSLTGTTTTMPNYTTSRATSTGSLTNISLSPATKTTEFGFLFNGFLHVSQAGAYTLQVTSSDGANVYLGALNGAASPYSATATPLINNNGVHDPATAVSSASTNLSVGLYPIAVAYFQGASGTASLQLSWKTPGSSTFVPIPTIGFTDTAVVNGQVPALPTNLAATATSFNKVSLSWTDNSGGKATTEIWRSTSATTGFAVVGNTGAGVSSFVDSSASPSTTYYYEIKADNVYGESALTAAVSATTQALPTIPTVPSGVTANAVSYSSVNLSWTNTASNANTIFVYRSAVNDQQYVQWAVLPGTAASFVDTGLYANSVYFYKIQAVNAGGPSAFTPEVSVTTLDNRPVITKLAATIQAKIGATTTINVTATQPGTNALSLKAFNLPNGFATFTDNGNRTGTLTVNPTAANAGTYPGVYITVTDAYGGADTTTFSLAVNNSTPPTLSTISNVTMNEGDTLSVALTGTNTQSPSDVLNFTATGTPARSVLTALSNGSAKLFLQPSYSAGGVYTVQVTLTDATNGLTATQNFTVTVKNKNPNTTIYTRFAYNDATKLGLPWNALQGATTNNLLDSNGNVTSVGVSFSPTTWWNTYNGGSTTGNNSGVYPDIVLQDYYWFGSVYGGPDVINGTISGVDTSLYDLTFFANSVYSGFGDNGYTNYTAGGQTVTLHVQNNTKNTVTIPSLKAVNGTIPFSMAVAQTGQLGYINALVITKHYDDGTAPAGVSGLTATNGAGVVKLAWTDSAYNATGYQIYRSLKGTGNYNLLNTVNGNAASAYTDSTVASNTAYTYEVAAVNTHGSSAFDSVSITSPAVAPKITAIQNIVMNDTTTVTVNVTTTADPSSTLTLTAANLPPFATFVDNGGGKGVLTLAPSAGTVGIYSNVSITVTDQNSASATTSFSVAVTEPNVQSIYLSLSGGPVAPAPWNTITTAPFQGTVVNLKDDGGTTTGATATLLDGWYWYGFTGWMAGNGQGTSPTQSTYPPSVAQNFFYEPTTASRRIQFSGLNNAKQYNFVFYNSMWDGTNGLTWFTINNDSVSLQADWNVNKTVQLNGIRPVNGVVTVTVHKASGAANAYLNSIVLQAYDTTAGTLIGPADLRATRMTQTTVSLQWQDRSAIETGYEVWRANDANGSYSLLASLPAKTTTYMDTKLSKNTNYYYIVRAINGSTPSNFSSVLAVTTYQDAIYVHPSYTSAGAGPTPPWNNLNNSGNTGARWTNWIDSTGAATSVGMTLTGTFAGPNSLGDVTGNNSGVYPDPVLLQQYVLFPGNNGSFTVSGLTLSKTYDFTFFGTEDYETGNQNTAYIVNGDTVFLNCLYNQQAVVTLYGITPNALGQVSLQMICYGQSIAGWFNAMVINGYTAIPRTNPTVPTATGGSLVMPLSTAGAQFTNQAQTVSTDSVVTAYPNPFHTSFTLSVPVFTTGEKVILTLYDMSGRLAYRKEFDDVQQGVNYLQVGEDGSIGGPGVYIGKVVFGSGRASQAIKLIKQ